MLLPLLSPPTVKQVDDFRRDIMYSTDKNQCVEAIKAVHYCLAKFSHQWGENIHCHRLKYKFYIFLM